MKQHWLLRPGTIRLLWIGFALLLALTLLAGLLLSPHAYFGLVATLAFNAWYGFASCIGMILGAKALGRLLKRKDSYYDGD